MSELLDVPFERDLTWMDMICNPWGGPRDQRAADQWQPIPFDAPLPWKTLDGRVAIAPAVAALSDPVAVLAIGKHRGLLPPLGHTREAEAEIITVNRTWALQHWPLPEPPCEIVHDVAFTPFARWLADPDGGPLAYLGRVVIDRRDLAPIFTHLHAEPFDIVHPTRLDDDLPELYLCGTTWRVIYQPVPTAAVAHLALPSWSRPA